MANKPRLIPLSLNGITGSMTIEENGTYNVKHLAEVIVDVPTSGGGGGDDPTPDEDPIGDEKVVQVIKWSAFQALDKSIITDQIYSIEL